MAVKATTLEVCNIIGLVDKSGSMGETDAPNSLTRWKYAEEFFAGFVRAVSGFDEDGMDLNFFNNSQDVVNGVTADTFKNEWTKRSPAGGTSLAAPLQWALDLHFERKAKGENRSTLIIVLTDGEPQDRASVAGVIINGANKLDRDEELAILFLQVGHDAGAKAFLASLDDDLEGKGAKFDIVDAKNVVDIGNMSPNELVEAAFND